MLRILRSVLRGMRAALAALAGSIASLVGAILGGGGSPRPPAAMLEPPVVEKNPVLDDAEKTAKHARLIARWAGDCMFKGRAQVPSELPPDLQLWAGNLSRDEIERVVIAEIQGIRAHLSGAAPIAGVMPVGGKLVREVRRQEPMVAADYAPAAYASR